MAPFFGPPCRLYCIEAESGNPGVSYVQLCFDSTLDDRYEDEGEDLFGLILLGLTINVEQKHLDKHDIEKLVVA